MCYSVDTYTIQNNSNTNKNQVDIVKFAVPEQTQKANSVEFRLVFGKGARF